MVYDITIEEHLRSTIREYLVLCVCYYYWGALLLGGELHQEYTWSLVYDIAIVEQFYRLGSTTMSIQSKLLGIAIDGDF